MYSVLYVCLYLDLSPADVSFSDKLHARASFLQCAVLERLPSSGMGVYK